MKSFKGSNAALVSTEKYFVLPIEVKWGKEKKVKNVKTPK